MKINFKTLATAILISTALLLSGCNTAAGFGKDLQKGGEKIQKAAKSK
jgi:predicted small secreted protein